MWGFKKAPLMFNYTKILLFCVISKTISFLLELFKIFGALNSAI